MSEPNPEPDDDSEPCNCIACRLNRLNETLSAGNPSPPDPSALEDLVGIFTAILDQYVAREYRLNFFLTYLSPLVISHIAESPHTKERLH